MFLAEKGGKKFIPIYIGQALRLRGRIRRQLNNLRLMRELEAASGRKRFITYTEFIGKPGQETAKALNTIERSLITPFPERFFQNIYF